MKFKKFEHQEDFFYKDKQIFLTESGLNKVKKRKKITGSRLAAVLGKNSFTSPFKVWCDILGFYEMEMEDFFIKAGISIEPKLLKFFSKKLNKDFVSYDAREIYYDAFREVEIFGGIPDGEEYKDGKVTSILEIKTTQIDKYQWKIHNNEYILDKKDGKPQIISYGGGLSKWFKKKQFLIPEEYKYQLALYLYLRNIDTGYFGVAFLNQDDYFAPENFDPETTNQTYADLMVDENLPENLKPLFSQGRVIVIEKMIINLQEFQKIVDYAKDWYEKHIIKGISPELTDEDLEWFRYGFPNI